jgi:hypothetical protein
MFQAALMRCWRALIVWHLTCLEWGAAGVLLNC